MPAAIMPATAASCTALEVRVKHIDKADSGLVTMAIPQLLSMRPNFSMRSSKQIRDEA